MRRMRTRLPLGLLLGVLAAAVLAAVLVVVVRSSGSVLTIGPLGPPGNHDSNCLPGGPKVRVDTEGNQNVTNSGHDTIVVDRLVLASPRHLKLTGAYLVPGQGLVGTWPSFPPPAGKVDRYVQWNRRERPAGARIPPGQTVNLVFGVEQTTNGPGSTAGIEVLYHDGGTRHSDMPR